MRPKQEREDFLGLSGFGKGGVAAQVAEHDNNFAAMGPEKCGPSVSQNRPHENPFRKIDHTAYLLREQRRYAV